MRLVKQWLSGGGFDVIQRRLVKRKPGFNLEVVAGDGGDGKLGCVGLELRVGFEEGGGGEGHPLLLFGGDADEWTAFAEVGAAVFDFGEVDLVALRGDEVNFVGFGAEVLGDEGVILGFQEGFDGGFGGVTLCSSVVKITTGGGRVVSRCKIGNVVKII